MTAWEFTADRESKLIPLSAALLKSRGVAQVQADLRRILRSARFEIVEEACAFRLLGPDLAYHAIDPDLPDGLKAFGVCRTELDIRSYRRQGPPFDLCFEDSWSGWFIAQYLADIRNTEDVVLVHADDHTDMMPTLLVGRADGLTNPSTGQRFDPSRPTDWESAIASGCVGIGDFITPLYYGHRLHVRHVNNAPSGSPVLHKVAPADCRYDLIPDLSFAGIALNPSDSGTDRGSCMSGEDAAAVLRNLPRGRVIVHLDLDYFINDFNGNPGGRLQVSVFEARATAQRKMHRFFEALRGAERIIDRWIVATSPGFCSASHWPDLLDHLQRKIEKFSPQSKSQFVPLPR
jgi:hypothetical protein